jgi:hypothetical protein
MRAALTPVLYVMKLEAVLAPNSTQLALVVVSIKNGTSDVL